MTPDELDSMTRVPRYSIVAASSGCAIAEGTHESGPTRLLGNGRVRLSPSACVLVLAELHAAIDAGWRAGLAQALLALEDQTEEVVAATRAAA